MIKNFLLYSSIFLINSIYSFQINSASGDQINFNDFRNKKILLVNIATGSEDVNQLEQLEQLCQIYKDSLVVIAFPSNSFGNEPLSNLEIDNFCRSNYHTTFLIAEKQDVIGDSIQPVYHWLALKTENGRADTRIKTDFQKFLIDKDGYLIGIFSSSVNPLSNELTNVINNN